ncbi:MAG: LysM peptidoglycan-binding domain-containing protein [Chloroflexi bacterium]|jgi:LysM repeat protein|nr:LysM peptidoglycan-binding domain-containing protein [Anaerolineaceae bacterium]NMB89748.1 LysM peptidoglycan-binding domain-containing protein [Chloroflexota bacterium]
MKQLRHYSILWVAMMLVVILSACQRPASQAPVSTPAGTEEFPFPVVTQEDVLKQIMTQTAIAQTTPGAAGEGTNEVGGGAPEVVATSEPPTAEPTAITYASPTPGHPSTYVLQDGEFPYCIARRFNIDPVALLNANGWGVNTIVTPGTTVRIPDAGGWNAGSRSLMSHPTTYTVKSGDTIYKVACAFGDVDPNTIIAANGLESPYTLTAGATLQIP